MSEIYTGAVRIQTTDKDNNPLVIKNGKRAGQPWCRVSFKVGEEWLNLADFSNDAAGFDGQQCKVAYSEKVDDFGDPILYNGKKQYNLEAIKPVNVAGNGPTLPQNAQPAVQSDDRQESIQRQTAAKCASEITAAIITKLGATDDPGADTPMFDQWFDHILARIENKPDIVKEAMDKLGASEEDEDSDDIPFLS